MDKIEKPVEPVVEDKKPVVAVPPVEAAKPKAPTAKEVLDGEKPAVATKTPGETVPLSAFLDEKTGRKEAEANAKKANTALEALKKSIEAGDTTAAEVSDDIAALGTKYGVDSSFLSELTGMMEAKANAVIEPLKAKDRELKIDKAFTKAYNEAMTELPDFKDIVNKEVIKALALDSRNAQKTFIEIIEEAYGSAIPGRSNVETNIPAGGKEPTGPLDMVRARKDTKYFEEIMNNPKLKSEYNETMLKEGL